MKKFSLMLVIVSVLFCSIPIKADAATSFTKVGDKYVSQQDVSAGGKYGVYKKGDVSYQYIDENAGIKKWEFYLTANTTLSYVYIQLVPYAIEIQDVQAGAIMFNKLSFNDNKLLLEVKSPNSVKSGDKVLLFTVTTKDTSDEGCNLGTNPQVVNNCDVINGIYFDKNGKKVTAEEYNASCNGTTQKPDDPTDDPNDIPNPKSGSVVPYVAIGGGLLAVAGVYLYSRKANRMYKL